MKVSGSPISFPFEMLLLHSLNVHLHCFQTLFISALEKLRMKHGIAPELKRTVETCTHISGGQVEVEVIVSSSSFYSATIFKHRTGSGAVRP